MITSRLLNVKRIRTTGNRDTINGLCLDRNEKVDPWNTNHFDVIHSNISNSDYSFYPDDNFDFLFTKLANHYNVSRDNFHEGMGADYLIRDFFILHNDPNKEKKVVIMDINYEMYLVYPQCLNYTLRKFKFDIDLAKENVYSLNKDYFYSEVRSNDIIVLTIPNQLSNFDITLDEIDTMCAEYPEKVFLIDEVYFGYGSFTTIELIKKYRNIFVIRSASKEFGLAALRFGLLFAHGETLVYFKNISSTYNTNIFTAKTIEYFLDNFTLIEDHREKLIEGREYLKKELRRKGYKVNSSDTMSVFLFLKNEKETDELYEKLKKLKIYTKKYSGLNSIRVTCGPKQVMTKVADNIDFNFSHFKELF